MEGIYFFGGMNSSGYSINKLFILRIQKNNLKWHVPDIGSKPPPPRYGHSMHHVDWLNSIIIYGGRYDCDAKIKDSKPHLLNDLWLLGLKDLIWTEVVHKGEIPTAVYAHNSEIYGSQIIIFGGLRSSQKNTEIDLQLEYNTNSFLVCELHQKRANLLSREYEVKLLIERKRKEREEDIKKRKFGIGLGVFDVKYEEPISLGISESYDVLNNIHNMPHHFSKANESTSSHDRKQILKHIENIENGDLSFIKD